MRLELSKDDVLEKKIVCDHENLADPFTAIRGPHLLVVFDIPAVHFQNLSQRTLKTVATLRNT